MSIWIVTLILTIASFFAAGISAVIGMAGGIILLSIMTFFLDLSILIPIHGIVQLASNSSRALSLRESVETRILAPSIFGLIIGTAISTQLIQWIPNRESFYILIVALILYVLFKPKKLPALKIPYWAFGVLGLVAGVLNPIIGAIGPLIAPFFLREDLTKEQIIATKAATQTVGHLLKIPAFLYLGFDYLNHWVLISFMVLGVILGTQMGVRILKKVNEKTFRLVFRTALLIAALRLTYKLLTLV